MEAPANHEVLVDPFDLTLVWPLRLRDFSGKSHGSVRATVKTALTGSGWEQIHDLVRRNEPASQDGFAFAEMAYFHPFVQRFFYGNGITPRSGAPAKHHFDLFDLPSARESTLEILERSWCAKLTVQEMLFHSFEGSIGFLTMRLAAAAPIGWKNVLNTISFLRTVSFQHYSLEEIPIGSQGSKSHFWQGGGGIEGVTIHRFRGEAPESFEHDREGEMREGLDTLEPRLFQHWSNVLKPLKEAKIEARPLGDHRIPVMAFLGLADPQMLTKDDWFALSQADAPGFPPCVAEFRDKVLDGVTYDRWWESSGTRNRHRYLAGPMTYFSVIAVAPKARPSFLDRVRTSWRRQHYQMFLLAQYQRAALLVLQDRIARAASQIGSDESNLLLEIEAIQKEMAVFSSGRYFSEISPQIQAQELYSLLKRQLQIESLYDGVISDKALLGNWITSREERRRDQRWELINRVVIPLGLAFSFLGASVGIVPLQSLLKAWYPKWADLGRDSMLALVTVALAVAVGNGCITVVKWWQRRQVEKRP